MVNAKSKAKDGEKKEKGKKEERPKVGNNNGQLRIATPPRLAHVKPPGPILCFFFCCFMCSLEFLCALSPEFRLTGFFHIWVGTEFLCGTEFMRDEQTDRQT